MRWEINCSDPHGRPRKIHVESTPGHIGVTLPPGEGFSLDADQADTLGYVMRVAADHSRGWMASRR